jgi:hypothetical protein
VAFAAWWLLPQSMQRPFYWYMINGRFVALFALFAPLLLRRPIEGGRRWLLLPVVAANLFYAGDLARMVVRFNRHVDGFDELVQQIPLHRATLTLVIPPLDDPDVNVNCFNQWPSYTQIRRGGYNFYNFNYGFPLRYVRWKPAPPWNNAASFQYDQMADAWDYFLTHNEAEHPLFAPYEAQGRVRLVGARGPWKLWQRVGPPAPLGPLVDVPVDR